MLAAIRSRLGYANVMASIAVFIALGAGAYAAGLAPDSVKSKHIKDGQVKTEDVLDDGLTGTDIAEDSLESVPEAGNAGTLDGKDSGDFASAGSEAWQDAQLRDGSLPELRPDFIAAPHDWCYWTNYGNGHTQAAYFRDRAGVVHLKGLVKANNGNSASCLEIAPQYTLRILDLPAGYRPAEKWVLSTVSANKAGRINLFPDGRVEIENGFPTWPDAFQWVSLDGISFRCAPAGENGCP